MNELVINYGDSKTKKIINIVIGAYFAGFSLYFLVVEWLAKLYGLTFFCALIGLLFGLVLVLGSTLLTAKPILKIDNTALYSNLSSEKGQSTIEWAGVSEMNIGVSYLIFIMNGQKQQKIDLSGLLYRDLKEVKSKAIEICEFKNIPYKND